MTRSEKPHWDNGERSPEDVINDCVQLAKSGEIQGEALNHLQELISVAEYYVDESEWTQQLLAEADAKPKVKLAVTGRDGPLYKSAPELPSGVVWSVGMMFWDRTGGRKVLRMSIEHNGSIVVWLKNSKKTAIDDEQALIGDGWHRTEAFDEPKRTY